MTKTKKTIFICDDNPGNLEVISTILNENYKVKSISKFSQLKTALKKQIPNLIIIDHSFGSEKAPPIISELRNTDSTQNLPIILTSAANRGKELAEGLEVTDFLPKPFDLNALLSLIQKHI